LQLIKRRSLKDQVKAMKMILEEKKKERDLKKIESQNLQMRISGQIKTNEKIKKILQLKKVS